MIWHTVGQVCFYLSGAWGLVILARQFRQGQLRRLWNWPMRVGLSLWLLAALLSSVKHGSIAAILFLGGFLSLVVFVLGFGRTTLRDVSTPPEAPKYRRRHRRTV